MDESRSGYIPVQNAGDRIMRFRFEVAIENEVLRVGRHRAKQSDQSDNQTRPESQIYN
jgi:hypothetical protein